MKSKSPAQSQAQIHLPLLETPKKKISTSVDGCRRVSDDSLQTPKTKRRSSTKKSQRKRRPSESDEEKIDKKTEENIQQVALKNNLTEEAVKKILKKVVSNDHVLAIVKLKEEEMEKNNQANKSTDEEDDLEDVDHAPKITRSKAKVLNKIILPITSPSEPSEASILIQEELRSDDEDEEYEPGNEDVHSDDEHNSSVSDMDSQPRTPRTPYTAEEDTPTKYTNDGLFKIPRDLNDSSASSLNDQDYIIAKRTRSKVSLATTSIETIESTFQPPDISPDMYDRDNELDTDWLEFLNVLTKPINQTVEDDDETDPEYIAAADQIPNEPKRWRGSIYKLVWLDLVCFLFIYYFLNIMYRTVLDDGQKRIFEGVGKYCSAYSNLIPLSFVLGFYVSIVMTRWWQQYSSIPWPDSLGVYVSANVHGQDERGRLMRRTIMRYVCLCLTMVLTNISPRVKKRFPTLQHLYQAGLLAENEKCVMETFNSKFKSYSKHWMPIVWAASIITRARKEGRIRDDFAVKTLIDELNKFRGQAGLLIAFDTISVPLVYTQVVTLAVYSYFITAVVGQQWVENKTIEEGFVNMIDMYFPIFSLLQFFFYMGWLKVAESLINPFGEDDDDFEVSWMVDRNLQVSYMIVDEMHNDHPELIKDQYWDEIFPNELPYTNETKKESHPLPSTANIHAAVNANARHSGKFDEMGINDDAASGIHFTAGRKNSRRGSSASVSSMANPTGSMTRVNTVASALKRFFSTDSSKSTPCPDIRLTGSASSASITNQYPKYPPAGSMKISDQVIEEVDEQLTITSMRNHNEPRPTAQSLFMPHTASKPVDVPTSSSNYITRIYNRTHSNVEPPTSNSFIFPMNSADMEYFVSASAPTPNIECSDIPTTPNDGFDFNYKEIDPETFDEDDDFEKLRLTREKERLERQKQKLARSISTQPNQNSNQ